MEIYRWPQRHHASGRTAHRRQRRTS